MSFPSGLLLRPLSLSFCACVRQPASVSFRLGGVWGVGTGCPRPPAILCSLGATLLQGSPVASILLFSGPAWDIPRFPSLPLWGPLSPPLHLASGNAREGAVASGAWLGTRDPRRQLRQHDEHRLRPLGICTYRLAPTWPAVRTPAAPRPAPTGLALGSALAAASSLTGVNHSHWAFCL